MLRGRDGGNFCSCLLIGTTDVCVRTDGDGVELVDFDWLFRQVRFELFSLSDGSVEIA